MVSRSHYIGRLGSTSVSLGLFEGTELVGVVAFGTIPRNNAASICGPSYTKNVMELTRLALIDQAPRNSESWFIGKALGWLSQNRSDVQILISYADASVGHVGTVYQATNWVYTGKSGGDVVWLCDDGKVLHPRTTGWDKSVLPPGRWRPSPGKHRYVTFVGAPSVRREARKNLRWKPLPYPKQDIAAPLLKAPVRGD